MCRHRVGNPADRIWKWVALCGATGPDVMLSREPTRVTCLECIRLSPPAAPSVYANLPGVVA